MMDSPPIAKPGVTPASRVIFLDVDGVLTSQRAHLVLGYPMGQRQWFEWDPVAIEAIKLACCKDVRLVISSTWRLDRNKDELFRQLEVHGMTHLVRQPNWKTPDLQRQYVLRDGSKLESSAERGDEIAAYLRDNPDIRSYRIVDDDRSMLPEQMPYCIFTHSEDGMSSENIRALLRWSGYLKS